MKKPLVFSLFLFVISCFSSYGQNVEDLKKKLLTSKEDTIKLQVLTDLHWGNAYVNNVEAKKYARQELALALKLNSKKWEAQAYNDLGISEQLDLKYKEMAAKFPTEPSSVFMLARTAFYAKDKTYTNGAASEYYKQYLAMVNDDITKKSELIKAYTYLSTVSYNLKNKDGAVGYNLI
jgi:hypothetical protein